MNEDVIKRLEEYDLIPEDLTAEELKQLEEQIENEKKGTMMLDGGPNWPDIFYRESVAKRQLAKNKEDSSH